MMSKNNYVLISYLIMNTTNLWWRESMDKSSDLQVKPRTVFHVK